MASKTRMLAYATLRLKLGKFAETRSRMKRERKRKYTKEVTNA